METAPFLFVMKRNQSLDALRGYAILTMILSGSIAYGDVLPAWMFHAQVPPPDHKFIPAIPGITWVDLVFPFFLFSMGAAIPLSLAKAEKENINFFGVLWIAFRRFVLLTFFALFTYHMRAWVIAEQPTATDHLLSILAFILLCFQFYEYKGERRKTLFNIVRIAAFALAFVLLFTLPFNKGEGFKIDKVDIIILVLGNMAFFGTVLWWLTKNNQLLRWGLLAFVMAIFLGSKEVGSWNEQFYNYSPVPWMYKFYYLKYLFVIVPGTIAGELLLREGKKNTAPFQNSFAAFLFVLSLLIIIVNVSLLFSRALVLNLFLTVTMIVLLYFSVKKYGDELLYRFWQYGSFLLLLGLTFDAYEGGIKKDPSNYSYYFVTCGLAFFAMIAFTTLSRLKLGSGIVNYLSLNGRNPMVAYVAGNLLLLPLLSISGVHRYWNMMNTDPFVGFLKGVLFTGVVSLVTIFFTKRKWFWKT